MYFTLVRIFFTVLLSSLACGSSALAQSQPQLITIAAGGVNGVYYAVAGSICRQLNRDRSANTRCAVEVSDGSVANITLLRRGVSPFAIVQADVHYAALHGTGAFSAGGAQKDLRSVFSLYPEVLTFVAAKKVVATDVAGMKGQRLSLGLSGSGGRATVDSLFGTLGWDSKDFPAVQERSAEEQGYALCEQKIDGFAYLVGHPAPNVLRVARACEAHLLPLSEAAISQFIANKPYLQRTEIPANTYPGQTAAVASVGVLATVMVLESASQEQVYTLVRAVFENLEQFKQSNPVLANLQPGPMRSNGLSAPLHPGALRYYREKGWL